ncbi:hypothetical protein I7I48_07331 [Histoplasma ohiense]|nr:hypothetical protein I7I48_07331 [Histoplasma ohiense (nom. inval.)]
MTYIPAGSLPNGFSGMILEQHSFLDLVEYHGVRVKVPASKGVDPQDSWGEIRLGYVLNEEYRPL